MSTTMAIGQTIYMLEGGFLSLAVRMQLQDCIADIVEDINDDDLEGLRRLQPIVDVCASGYYKTATPAQKRGESPHVLHKPRIR
jgi:hypothetical protein